MLDFKLNEQMETFSLSSRIILFEAGRWQKAVNSFRAITSVFNLTDENNTFSFTSPGQRFPPRSVGNVEGVKKLIQLRSQKDI